MIDAIDISLDDPRLPVIQEIIRRCALYSIATLAHNILAWHENELEKDRHRDGLLGT